MLKELEQGPGTVPSLTKRVGLDPRSTALYPEAKRLLDEEKAVKNGAVYELAKPKTRAAKKSARGSAAKAGKKGSKSAAKKPG
jgi:predicted transcriptional regulator